MFDVGIPEVLVLVVVALLVFGPDKLPDFARQAGRLVRQLRHLSQQARDDIRAELGPDYADFELTDLDPRRVIRKHIQEAWDEADDADEADSGGANHTPREPERSEVVPLQDGERPPYDADAT
jgi:sec-independent protein translocase protein TatB